MPQMGVSVSEGTVVEWRKRVGDWVAYEEAICDISTDKIDTEVPSPAAGRLAEVLVEPGTTVEVGTVLARLATDARPGEPHASEQAPPPPATSEAAAATGDSPAPATSRPAPRPAVAAPTGGNGDGGRRYSPVVQRIAAEHGIDLARVEG
ncbi:MAG TPA: biotin/lipoyl-containing protein, partial [Solirubrobacteraceae bacterium]|nr:biotin/lipoyl-containing protein [Solirubrobacteraceae bacterium]